MVDATGAPPAAPPAVDAGVAPVAAPAAAPAADQPMSREQILHEINQAPPEERAQMYQRYSDFFHRDQAPVPSREQVEDAHDAEVRLAALTNDPAWIRKYNERSPAERAEAAELQEIIRAGRDADGLSVRVGDAEVIDAISDPHGVRRSDVFGVLSDLNRLGIPEAGLERILDGNFSDEEYEFAERELDRLKNDPVWQKALCAGDRTARHELAAWSAVAGSRKVL
jgi:hypothetical protein